MITVGITGGIGSGKSTVCKLFEGMGVPVYYTDESAKQIIAKNKEVVRQVKKLFGKDIYDSAGNLKTKDVSRIIFSDAKKLKEYNNIVHPAVFKAFAVWEKKYARHPYGILESALLFETGLHRKLDYTITIQASKQLRLQRVMRRDNVPRSEVIKRMNNQWSEKQRNEKADFFISNTGKKSLILQVQLLNTLFTQHDKIKLTAFYKKSLL